MSMIEVKDLTKYYGPTLAVDRVSFSVEKGQIVGFLGPNGAGKTTTIRMLTCFMPASGGSATVAGYDVFSQSMEVRERIGYLPESVPFYPEMRVNEYLKFRGELRGLDRSTLKTRMGAVIQSCWLGDVATRPIGQLSKGYRQRLGLADALLHDPQVLILDEPTVGLDPTQIRATRALIQELGQRHTIMLSSHILSEVQAVCSHAIIIASGRAVASGSIEQLQKEIREQSRLIVEVRGPADAVVAAVKGIDGVQEVESQAEGDVVRLTLAVGGDPREKIAAVIAARGWALRELRLDVATLEDFFIRAVASAKAA